MKKILLCLILVGTSLVMTNGNVYIGKGTITPKFSADKLRQDLRKLWSDHVFWTRNYILTATLQSHDDAVKKVAADRLFKNQEDIGNAVAKFYGADAGEKLTALLKDHIQIAAEIIDAAMVNAQDRVKKLSNKWQKNATDIATFLSDANPNFWSKDDLETMLKEHLKLTTQELTNRLNKNWQADIESFDQIYDQILGMSDALANGIISQFANKF